ncbi:hypothetical protein HK099_006147, partial [Clydaea vesicula]
MSSEVTLPFTANTISETSSNSNDKNSISIKNLLDNFKDKSHSINNKISAHKTYFDGVRGFAAFQVFSMHFMSSNNFLQGDDNSEQLSVRNQTLFSFPFLQTFIGRSELSVPLFYVLSGRVLVTSMLRSAKLESLSSAFVRRLFRLTIPVMGAYTFLYIMFQIGLFHQFYPTSLNGPLHSYRAGVQKPPFEVGYAKGVVDYPYGILWTLHQEFYNSYYVFITAFALFSLNYRGKVIVLTFLIIVNLVNQSMSTFFFIGVALSQLSITKFYEEINKSRYRSILHFSLGLFLFIRLFDYGLVFIRYIDYYFLGFFIGADSNYNPVDSNGLPTLYACLFSAVLIMLLELNQYVQFLFSCKPMELLGKMSFGLYLLHPLWFGGVTPHIINLVASTNLPYVYQYLLVWFGTFLALIPGVFVFYQTFDLGSVFVAKFIYSIIKNAKSTNLFNEKFIQFKTVSIIRSNHTNLESRLWSPITAKLSADYLCNGQNPFAPEKEKKLLKNLDLNKLKNDDVIFVETGTLPTFVKRDLPNIKTSFVLVSGDGDGSPIATLKNSNVDVNLILKNTYLKHWYAMNCDYNPDPNRFSCIPLGISQWNEQRESLAEVLADPAPIRLNSKKFILSSMKVENNYFHRKEPYELGCKVGGPLYDYTECFYEENNGDDKHQKQVNYYKTLASFRFVISPFGRGFDCYRTWEALYLGVYPIVKSSQLDEMYTDLPVLIVKEWSDLSLELIKETYIKFKAKKFNLNKLYKEYW